MFIIEEWMFNLGLSGRMLLVFAYVYNCIKSNSWNPKEISSDKLARIMKKHQPNISSDLNALCTKLGLLEHSGNTSNNCCLYSLTPKVFEVSKDVPVTVNTEGKDYSEELKQIFDKFHSVLGVDVYPIEFIGKYATPLLSVGQTVDDLCAVVECKGKEWRDDIKMCPFIRPQTLFGEKYETYLFQSKIKPAENDIDISFINRIYAEGMQLTPPSDLAEWCSKTLKDNPDLDIVSLGWTIAMIYKSFQEKDSDEWLQRKMESTSTLSKQLASCKEKGILFGKVQGEYLDDFRWGK